MITNNRILLTLLASSMALNGLSHAEVIDNTVITDLTRSNSPAFNIVRPFGTTISEDEEVYMVGSISQDPFTAESTWVEAAFLNGTQRPTSVGEAYGNANFGIIREGGGFTASGAEFTVGVPITFALKVNLVTGDQWLWVNPDFSAAEDLEAADATANAAFSATGGSPLAGATLDGIMFRSGFIGTGPSTISFTDFAVYYNGASPFGGGAAAPSLSSFTYDPSTGESEVTIDGLPSTAYFLVEADDLDFGSPDQSPVPLTGATVGALDGNQVTTDGDGSATVQFNLGTAKPATFVRAEQAPPPPPFLEENFDAAAALPTGWSTNGPVNGTAWEVGIPSGVASGPVTAFSEPNSAGTNIGAVYTANTDVSLFSPSIAIPANSSAVLRFRQLIDTDTDGDFGSVRVLDADNADAPIAGLEITNLKGLGSTAEGWTENTLVLPAADVAGKNIKIEFRFVSDADSDVFGGFYIDDVVLSRD